MKLNDNKRNVITILFSPSWLDNDQNNMFKNNSTVVSSIFNRPKYIIIAIHNTFEVNYSEKIIFLYISFLDSFWLEIKMSAKQT
jgi:hypothetical protein